MFTHNANQLNTHIFVYKSQIDSAAETQNKWNDFQFLIRALNGSVQLNVHFAMF